MGSDWKDENKQVLDSGLKKFELLRQNKEALKRASASFVPVDVERSTWLTKRGQVATPKLAHHQRRHLCDVFNLIDTGTHHVKHAPVSQV
eukprot:1188185-Prorocentrum_minimum.AAC.3